MDTERGLLVPVIRDVDRKSLHEVAARLRELADLAEHDKLKPQQLRGGCMTLTNVGAIGGLSFTPLINHPEAAILGVGRAHQALRPDGEGGVATRTVLPLCCCFDHRINDGAEAARFVNTICELLASPAALMAAL